MNQEAKLCDERQKETSFCSSNTGWCPRVFLKGDGPVCGSEPRTSVSAFVPPSERVSHFHVLIGCTAERGGAPRRRVCAEARSQMLVFLGVVASVQLVCHCCVAARALQGTSCQVIIS